MYFVDLLKYLKLRNYVSWMEALTIIQIVRRYGPLVAKADMVDDDGCIVRTNIGYGFDAVIEMDRNRKGKWEPVFGQVVKR